MINNDFPLEWQCKLFLCHITEENKVGLLKSYGEPPDDVLILGWNICPKKKNKKTDFFVTNRKIRFGEKGVSSGLPLEIDLSDIDNIKSKGFSIIITLKGVSKKEISIPASFFFKDVTKSMINNEQQRFLEFVSEMLLSIVKQ